MNLVGKSIFIDIIFFNLNALASKYLKKKIKFVLYFKQRFDIFIMLRE